MSLRTSQTAWEDQLITESPEIFPNLSETKSDHVAIKIQPNSTQNNGSSDPQCEKTVESIGYWKLSKLGYLLFKVVCYALMLIVVVNFSTDIVTNYRNEYTITVSTYRQLGERPRPTITICNNVNFDPEKIKNAENINEDPGRDLLQSINRAIGPSHVKSNYEPDPTLLAGNGKSGLVASKRTATLYRLEPESFMFGCVKNGERARCLKEFEISTEPYSVCYKNKEKNNPMGTQSEFSVFLYFSPFVNLGQYTKSIGGSVRVSRMHDSPSSIESFIPISPGEQLKITAEAQSRNQEKSTNQIQGSSKIKQKINAISSNTYR